MPNYTVQLVSDMKTWVHAELDHVSGKGHQSPLVIFTFTMRTPTERVDAQLHHLKLRAYIGDELLGEGSIVGGDVSSHGTRCSIEVPVTHRMMRYAGDSFPANADANLKLRLSGILRVKWRRGEGQQAMASDPPIDEWFFTDIVENDMNIGVPRSDWFGKIVQPMGDDRYVYLEVAVPQGATGSDWASALALVDEAEKAYALGDDAGVFAKLRGAYEALPGALKNIVDDLAEPRRTAVDQLLRHVGAYLHHGRHVATDGEEAGTFPVNRIDASAALALVRVLFSYVSRALEAARNTAS